MRFAPTLVRAIRSLSPRALTLIAGSLLIGCLADLTGPKSALGRLGIAPVFLNGTPASLVSFDRIRILIAPPGTSAAVVDTVISFAPSDTILEVNLAVPLGEPLELSLAFINTSGDTVFRSGPDALTATVSAEVVEPVLRYSGVGSNAAGVRFATSAATAHFQDTVVFVAEAFDANGAAIAGTPIVYELVNGADTNRARIPDPAVGRVVAGQVRGPVQLRARLLTGQSVGHTLTIQPLPSAINVVSGNNQEATVGQALPQTVVARVLAADGLPVQGTIVSFSVSGGSLSQTADTSDASGDVSVSWTLGNTAGSHTLTATVVSFPAATIGIAAIAQPSPASTLEFTTQPSNTTAGAGISIVLTAKDAHGNVATQFTSDVTLAISSGSGTTGAHLLGTATATAVAGVATFAGLAVDSAGSGYTITATTAGVPAVVSGAFEVLYGAATRLRFATQPSNAPAGTSFAPAVRVLIEDAMGNTVAVANDDVALTITNGTGSAGATLIGTSLLAAAAGGATFTGLNIQRSGTAYTLTATSGALTAATSSSFDIAAGPPATIALNDGNAQSVQVASSVATAPSVLVTDQYANPVAGVEVTFAVAGGGGSGAGLTQTTTSAGIARVTSWTVGTLVGANTMTATAGAITGSPVTFTATGIAGPPALFTVIAGNTQTVGVDAPVTTAPSVRLTDAHTNVLAGVQVTFAVASGGGVASGTTVTTDGNGEATVGGWTLGPTPTINELTATAGAATATISATATWNRPIATGLATACAIGAGSAVYCWGENSFQAFGPGTTTIFSSGTPILTSIPPVVAIADGMGRHYCGITAIQSAVCWGRNGFGQLGGGSTAGNAPVTVLGGITWAQLAMSILSTCGVSTSGVGYCWGSNQSGEIGVASIPLNTNTTSPIAVDGGLTFTRIAAGWQHVCGITTTGAAYCWGENANGQLGIGATSGDVRTPTAVVGGLQFVEIAAGAQQTCGITVQKQAYCWGFNATGQLGDGTMITRPSPTLVLGGHRFTSIVTTSSSVSATPTGQLGAAHTCALTETGEPHCWGANLLGQLGDGTRTDRLIPTPVQGGLRFNGMAVGNAFACGIRGSAIWCWGWNDIGQLGNESAMFETSPTGVQGGLAFQAVESGGSHSCGITTTGAAYCWGSNSIGQLGDGTFGLKTVPSEPVSGGLAFQSLSAGTQHTCGITTAGPTYCWGAGAGALGNGTASSSTTPVLVVGGHSFQLVSAGASHTCGVTTEGLAYCWGSNMSGQIGDGTQNQALSPVAVTGGFQWQDIAAGSNYTCGVTSLGVGYCWGANSNGQLGDGTTTTPRLTPTPIVGALTLQSVVVNTGQFHGCGLTILGAAYCWGFNAAGQAGNGTTGTTLTSPVAVLGGLTFSRLTAGVFQTCGLTTSVAAYCWGANNVGQLGDGTTDSRSTPTLVSGGLTFASISSRGSHSCGLASGGLAYCWGSNSIGQVGNNVSPTAPTRVSGF